MFSERSYTIYVNECEINQWLADGQISFRFYKTSSSFNGCSEEKIKISFNYQGNNYVDSITLNSNNGSYQNSYPSYAPDDRDRYLNPFQMELTTMHGLVFINKNQPAGFYDLDVFEQSTNDTVTLDNAFQVVPFEISPNWIFGDNQFLSIKTSDITNIQNYYRSNIILIVFVF